MFFDRSSTLKKLAKKKKYLSPKCLPTVDVMFTHANVSMPTRVCLHLKTFYHMAELVHNEKGHCTEPEAYHPLFVRCAVQL